MNQLSRTWLAALTFAGACAIPAAQAQTPSIANFNWLVGTWYSHNRADTIQETYVPAAGGQILVLFQAITGGQVSRVEIRSIREEAGKIIRQELAYKPGLILDAPIPTETLVSSDATHLVFTGNTMIRTGENTMTVEVKRPTPNDPSGKVDLYYTRQPNVAPQ